MASGSPLTFKVLVPKLINNLLTLSLMYIKLTETNTLIKNSFQKNGFFHLVSKPNRSFCD